MDRRERYDPEDIEHLMAGRSFNELLPEEQAYVLRHLSGPEEYEAMRALLLHMKDDPDHRVPVEADPLVRDRVMEAFREARQPRWRIWLNSIGAVFTPQEGFALWRPALALATLAALVVTTVVVVQRMNTSESALAEVQPAKQAQQQEVPVVGQTLEPSTDEDAAVAATGEQGPATVAETRSAAAGPVSTPLQAQRADGEMAIPPVLADAVEDVRVAEEREVQWDDHMAKSEAEVLREEPIVGHVVTMDELGSNMSVANATGKVRASAAPPPARDRVTGLSRSVAQQPDLLQLMASGW